MKASNIMAKLRMYQNMLTKPISDIGSYFQTDFTIESKLRSRELNLEYRIDRLERMLITHQAAMVNISNEMEKLVKQLGVIEAEEIELTRKERIMEQIKLWIKSIGD